MIKKYLLTTFAGLVGMMALCIVLLVGCQNGIIYHPTKYPEGLWDTSSMPLPIQDCFQSKLEVS